MTLLHVDEGKADARRQTSCRDIMVRKPPQIIVVQQWIGTISYFSGGLIDNGTRVEDRVMKGQERPAVTVAARVRQLQADEQIIVRTEGFTVGLTAFAQHPFQVGCRLVVEKQLPRVGPPLVEHRGRLAPDELGPAGAETAVTPKRQLIGPAVGRAVATLHGLDTEPVAGTQRADGHRLKQRPQVIAKAKVETE